MDNESRTGLWWRYLLSGGVAGAVSRTLTAPFDRVKVYLQVHKTRNNQLTLSRTLHLLYEEGGLKSFWRGNGINVLKFGRGETRAELDSQLSGASQIAPESAIKFSVYERLKRIIQRQKRELHLTAGERVFAGSLAGGAAQSVVYPLEVLKTRLVLRKTGQLNRGLVHFAAGLYKAEGLACFYKGFVPNLIGVMPYAGIDLALFETLRNRLLRREPDPSNEQLHVGVLLLCGMASCACGQLASYPFSLVRTRLQSLRISPNPLQPGTMTGQFRYIWRCEGLPGLYRGIVPNFIKVMPAVSITYVVYERMRCALGACTT